MKTIPGSSSIAQAIINIYYQTSFKFLNVSTSLIISQEAYEIDSSSLRFYNDNGIYSLVRSSMTHSAEVEQASPGVDLPLPFPFPFHL
jgi:hypothetical protein